MYDLWHDKMEKHGLTERQIEMEDIKIHIKLKEMYGLEHLNFYSDKKGNYCCKYISDPNDFIVGESLKNLYLQFLLNSLSMQQGTIYFEDYGKTCTGLDALKELYLPMKLAGL